MSAPSRWLRIAGGAVLIALFLGWMLLRPLARDLVPVDGRTAVGFVLYLVAWASAAGGAALMASGLTRSKPSDPEAEIADDVIG